jgi:glycosyltransferase involved in cell wall biosynthesis
LSAIIPAYNEADNIGVTISQLSKSLSKQPFAHQIIVIDDGSLDGTGIIASEHGADKIIKHVTPAGKSESISSAINLAEGEIVVLMDADGTYNPDDIPRLISPILKGEADVVIGSRFPTEGFSPINKFGNLLLSILYRFLFGIETSYLWSGFQAFKKDDLRELISDKFETGIDFNVELRYFASKKGLRTVEIPFRTRLRKSVGYSRPKSRLYSIKMGLRIYRRILMEAVKF